MAGFFCVYLLQPRAVYSVYSIYSVYRKVAARAWGLYMQAMAPNFTASSLTETSDKCDEMACQ